MARSPGLPPDLSRRLARAGLDLTLRAPDGNVLHRGARADVPVVHLRTEQALRALARRDHLGLAEAYLRHEVEVEGSLLEVMRATDLLDLEAGWWERLRLAAALWLRDRRGYDRESIAFHYDRPVDFFLPWLGRWRSYSHGFYASPEDDLDVAQERKLAHAFDALGLEPGMRVLDMGAGWGCFVEYAGLRGVEVEAITISALQHRYVSELIEQKGLPGRIRLVHFFDYRPERPLDGAVFLGTLEHVPETDRVVRFLARHLRPGARLYADFSAQRSSFVLGRFMKKYIWPGTIQYVNPRRLVDGLIRAGFNLHEMGDDTLSYALTVRDWGDRLERHRDELAREWGEECVRAFLLFLRGSEHFLRENRTQAYHLVAGASPAPLRRP